MRRIRLFPFSGEMVQMQTAFYSVTMQWEAPLPCVSSTPHHTHISSCLFEDHFWDTSGNSGVSEFFTHFLRMSWSGHFQVQTQEWRLVLVPHIHACTHWAIPVGSSFTTDVAHPRKQQDADNRRISALAIHKWVTLRHWVSSRNPAPLTDDNIF